MACNDCPITREKKNMVSIRARNNAIVVASKDLLLGNIKNYAIKSVGDMTVNNYFRYVCLLIVEHWVFESFIIIIILCNSFLLAYEDPTKEYTGNIHLAMVIAENVFLGVYTVEMIIKIFAFGFFFNNNSYLRDPWNVMDFTVVMLSWITFGQKDTNVSVIRIIRILRPLRTISAIPALAKLVQNLIVLIPPMGEILILFAFTILVFGTIGLSLFMGHLKGRCVRDDSYQGSVFAHGYEYKAAGEIWQQDAATQEDTICRYDLDNNAT